jgi:hypothetical protein
VQTLDSEHPSIASLYLTAAQRQALGKLLPKAASFLRQAATEHKLSSIIIQLAADDDSFLEDEVRWHGSCYELIE